MRTLQITIQDDLVQHFGMEGIQKFIEGELAFQRFKLMEAEIQKAMHDAKDVNWQIEFEKAREEAFKEYQLKRLEK